MVISALASKIKSYDHPGTMKPRFFTHAETRLRAQFVRGLASRAFQSFMAQMASAEHLVLPKGHALWRGAPSSTCLAREGYQVFQPIQLGGQFNQFNHFWFTLVTHQVLNWKPHDGDRCVWGFRNARYLHVGTVALYTTEHLPDSPALPGKSSPRRCKAYGDILSPHNLQRNGGKEFLRKTCLVTVLFCDLLYIQRKWTE